MTQRTAARSGTKFYDRLSGVAGSSPTRGLHDQVVDQLGMRIASGEIAEGAQIVPEEIGAALGVSRPVVREALRALQAKGMVRPRQKTGTRVLPMTEWELLDADVISWRVRGPDRRKQLDELTDLRQAVEIFAAGACASRATDQEIATLRVAAEDLATAGRAGDLPRFTQADIRYHTTILTASGNLTFAKFASPFAALLHAREDLATLPATVPTEVIDLHLEVVEAISAREATRAEAATRALIEFSRGDLERYLGAVDAAPSKS